ncbi:hypothetical protein EDD86DRAFT_196341 [Gorgonomyces haynaldii]|nr:hypothetical protein EDD86DRAFT_196341 [Gorgonomyces haynaldii]
MLTANEKKESLRSRNKRLETELLKEKSRSSIVFETLELQVEKLEKSVLKLDGFNGNDIGLQKKIDALQSLLDVSTKEFARKHEEYQLLEEQMRVKCQRLLEEEQKSKQAEMELNQYKYQIHEAQQTMSRMTMEYEQTKKNLNDYIVMYQRQMNVYDLARRENELLFKMSTRLGVDVFKLHNDFWKQDKDVKICMHSGCTARFGLFERRHHCRKCGSIFCQKHSQNKIKLNLVTRSFDPHGYEARVCDGCFPMDQAAPMDE